MSVVALVARYISGSLQDLITRAGPSAEHLIITSRHRLLGHLEARDEDGAAREMEDHLTRLDPRSQIIQSTCGPLTNQEARLATDEELLGRRRR